MNLGGIYKDLGNLDQALNSILKGLEIEPRNPIALMFLGDIYEELGNHDQAIASTLKSLELKPDNIDALSFLFNEFGQGYSLDLRSIAQKAIEENKNILNKLSFIEAISSLGSKTTGDIISGKDSTN